MTRRWPRRLLGAALGVLLALLSGTGALADHLASLKGRTETQLADGRYLVAGGMSAAGPLTRVAIVDRTTGLLVTLPPLSTARAWHTASMLPDGTVLVFGGVTASGEATDTAERIDPASGTVAQVSATGLTTRAQHTATVLTDGRLLLAGGWEDAGRPVDIAEVWMPATATVERVPHGTGGGRFGHHATLAPDGSVWLTDGKNASAQPTRGAERFDPVALSLTVVAPGLAMPEPSGPADVTGSIPEADAVDVSPDSRIALRFSKPLRLDSLSPWTVTLTGPGGLEPRHVVPAEDGRLVFITPAGSLTPGTAYTVTVSGAHDENGEPAAFATLRFTTRSTHTHDMAAPAESDATLRPPHAHSAAVAPQAGGPQEVDEPEWRGARRNGKPYSTWESLAPYEAPAGVTALTGQVLRLDGQPLADVTLAVGARSTRTDSSGRFLLPGLPSGRQILLIDGSTANRPGENFMTTDYGVTLAAGQTTVLPFTIWMPLIDLRFPTMLSGPSRARTVVRHPEMDGLELHLPANVELRHAGGPVNVLALTRIPVDRPIFPIPPGTTLFFTPQAHGAEVRLPDGRLSPEGIRILLPNPDRLPPGHRVELVVYDAGRDWHVYGHGTVSPDGRQIVPDPGVDFTHLTCFFTLGASDSSKGPIVAGAQGGDPVDLGSGLLTIEKTDLVLPDVIPIVMTRQHRAGDSIGRQLGVGFDLGYNLYLVGDRTTYQWAELIRPDASRLRYTRTSPGTDLPGAVMEHTATPTAFQKSRLSWNATRAGWDLTLRDGTVYQFAGYTHPPGPYLTGIRDRAGNQLTIARGDADTQRITQITSPNGRWVEVSYNASGSISQLRDNLWRTVQYAYDAQSRLTTVIDPAGGATTYTWASTPTQRIVSITDPKQITFLTNEYDANGRVTRQTQADATTFQFAYTVDGNGKVTQTDLTDPRGNVRRLTFNVDGQALTDIRAYGTALAQTTTYERQAGTNLITAMTDALGRRTEFTYDSMRNLLTVTRLAGTGQAVTTTFTYELTFNQVASVTDPLSHTTTFVYDTQGNLTSIIDPLSHQTTLGYNAAGQPTTIATPAGTTQLGYTAGDLTSLTDPTGNTTMRVTDGAGRVTTVTSPLGSVTRFEYDLLNQFVRITDPVSGQTQLAYDGNGNLLSVTDARSNTTGYAYNSMDRVITRADPLTRSETFQYDANGNPSQHTDRKSQVTQATYDALDRPTQVRYADASTTAYTWDAGNRLIQIVDSLAGMITRTYDLLDRLTEETTSQGTITYTHDPKGRRVSMTVLGQPTVTYTYDNADRLTQITQGSQTVTFTYDPANRRTSLTLPNGIVTEYAYDPASRLTGLTYRQGTTTFGTLTYASDAAGQRIAVEGTWARTGMPSALSGATYNAANRQVTFGGATLTYDLNGNLVSDGTNTYTWNTRNELVGITGPVAATFGYDGLGRRQQKTITGTTTAFAYAGLTPVRELQGATTVDQLTGLGIDEYLTRTDAAGTTGLLTDALGSTLAVTASAGPIQTAYTYEPFGATAVSGPDTMPFQYTGRENDGTGLYYYRARYYHPRLQRFIAEDPIGLAGGVNLYGYVSNSPIVFADPMGLYVTVTLYRGLGPNRFGHIGIGVNSSSTLGFYGDGSLAMNVGDPVPGHIELDSGHKVIETIRIDTTTPEQERAIVELLLQRFMNPGRYTFGGRNCANFVGDALKAGGLETNGSIVPRVLMRDIRQRYGAPGDGRP